MTKRATLQQLYTKTGPPPKCHDCGKSLPSSKPRVQCDGVWCCPDCAIQREKGELPRAVRPLRPKTPQEERIPGL